MKTYTLRFRSTDKDIFDAIKSGKKKVETRAATARYKNVEKGDKIIFVCGKNKFVKEIKKVSMFKSISAMLKKYKFKQINPFVGSTKELEAMYFSFPGYKEKITKAGLVALEFK
jgi:ASC-1-like (ASCH) protein